MSSIVVQTYINQTIHGRACSVNELVSCRLHPILINPTVEFIGTIIAVHCIHSELFEQMHGYEFLMLEAVVDDRTTGPLQMVVFMHL